MSQNDADTAAYISELIGRARKAQKVAEGFSQQKVDELAAAIAWEIAANDDLLQEIAEFSFEECQLGDVAHSEQLEFWYRPGRTNPICSFGAASRSAQD